MDYESDKRDPTDVPPMRTAGEVMREKARKLEEAEKRAAEAALSKQKVRAEDLAGLGACAHLRISYQTMSEGEQRVIRSWWACDDCGTRFAPVGLLKPLRFADEPKPTDKPPFIRPSVQRFANAMEGQLRHNDHKGGWSGQGQGWLLMRLKQEVLELELELQKVRKMRNAVTHVVAEAADVANFAMMIAEREEDYVFRGRTEDLYGALEPPT